MFKGLLNVYFFMKQQIKLLQTVTASKVYKKPTSAKLYFAHNLNFLKGYFSVVVVITEYRSCADFFDPGHYLAVL